MTYKKIAQLAGVSPSTVSKVMSGSTEISHETADRIRRIMKEYGCSTAKYYKSKNSGLDRIRIAVLVPEIISVHYAQQVSDIVRILDDKNIICNIYLTGFDEKKTLAMIWQLSDEGMTDGILTITGIKSDAALPLPIVSFLSCECVSQDYVEIDYKQGISDALQYLMDLGHRTIGFIGEQNTKYKQKMFFDAARDLQLSVNDAHVFLSSRRFEQIGREAAAYFLENGVEPTAFITAYDEIALGAIQAFSQAGLRVPEDVSFIGMNDVPFAEYASVPLTTIQTFKEEICHIAIRILLDKIMNPDSHATQHVLVKCQLIKRDTVCRTRR